MGNQRKRQIRIILLVGLVATLLLVLFFREDQSAKVRTNEKSLERIEKQIEERFNKLEESIKKLNSKAKPNATKVATATKPQTKPAVIYPIGCEKYRLEVAKYNWNVNIVLAIMKAESGCRSGALSSTGDRGLMQINWIHSAKVGGDLNKLYNPQTNIAVAYQIYSNSGFSPWSVCRSTVKCW